LYALNEAEICGLEEEKEILFGREESEEIVE
jgi:hypothetical protein